MDIGTLGIAGVAVITVICYLIGQAYLTAVAVGIVSGLAAVGVDQIGKQLNQ